MKVTKKTVVCAAVILIAAIILMKFVMGLSGQKVDSAMVESGNIEDFYTEEGSLSFGEDYAVIAKVSGPVKEVCVEENSQVKKGDILYVVDDKDYQYEIDKYKNSIARLQAQLEQSRIGQLKVSSPQEYLSFIKGDMDTKRADFQSKKTVYDGSEVLYSAGSISKVDFEKNKAAYENALSAWNESKSRYEQSRKMLNELKKNGIDESAINAKFYDSSIEALTKEIQSQEIDLKQTEDKAADCRVASDRDGIITSIPVKDMSMVQTGTPAIYISGHNKLEAQAKVLTSISPYIKEGDPASVTLEARGRNHVYMGTVSKVNNFAEKGTSALGLDEYRVQVKVDLEDQGELLERDGYNVLIQFQLYRGENKLLLPINSVFTSDKKDYVFKIEKGKAVKTPIEAEYKTGTQAVIESGVGKGIKVIANVDEAGIYDGAAVHD